MGIRCGRLAAVLLGLLLAGCQADRLQQAALALGEARRLDSKIDSAPDPNAAAAGRDRAFARAERLYRELLQQQPNLPEAHLGLAVIAWHAHHDLATAFTEAGKAISVLAPLPPEQLARVRASGRTGASLLAEAYADRASFLITRYTEAGGAAPGTTPAAIPTGPLQQALEDAARAVALDPRPDYRLLQDNLRRLAGGDAAPLDPSALLPR